MKHERTHVVQKTQHLTRLIACFLLVFIASIACISVSAQSGGTKIKVTGFVTDNLGEPLVGASVGEKGTTNATMTGVDGDYELSVPANATLVVTYVGFTTREVPVQGKTKLDITLNEDARLLDEVVVTALGIKRERKSLGYAIEEVKGSDLMVAREPNVTNSLAGRVAGLQIKQSASGAAGSSRIVLRGNSSISGNNQPLVVVDGIPINSDTGGSDDVFTTGVDRGSGLSDIAPDDIEAISVLKGPAAAALYGSRAANGVLMITTKKGGDKKGLGITVNSNFVFENPMELPKYQNVYGQGTDGKYNVQSANSWGAVMDGKTIEDIVRNQIVYAPNNGQVTDFIRTGSTWTNSIDISSASDKGTVRLGVQNLDNKGVVPNSGFRRTSVSLRGTANLSSKFSVDAKATYIDQKTENRVKMGGDPDNIFLNYLVTPRSVDINRLGDTNLFPDFAFPRNTMSVNGVDVSGKPASWTTEYAGMIRNPYWAAYKNTNDDRRHRFLGMTSLKYEFTSWLSIMGRYGIDYIASEYKNRQATNTPYWEQSGNYQLTKDGFYETNADFLVTLNRPLSDKLGLVATAGGNVMYQRSDNQTTQSNGLVVPDYFRMTNAVRTTSDDRITRQRINSLYATASLAYDNMLYLDLTGRNDWNSSLPSNNWSFFYPSVGASWLITESLDKWQVNHGSINFAKLRVSGADVGAGTTPYELKTRREYSVLAMMNGLTENSEAYLATRIGDTQANPNLKPERSRSYEVGLELKAFNNRVGLDFAFYNNDTRNQILQIAVPPATGFARRFVNAGKVRNRGVELVLSGTPVVNKDFEWNVNFNYSRNRNYILKLVDGIEQQILNPGSQGLVAIVARVNGSYGDLYGKAYLRDGNGQIMVDDSGLPLFSPEKTKLGNSNPDWMGGIINSFRYKNVNFSFQIDGRFGGDVYMGSIMRGTGAGTLASTLDGREGGILVQGVRQSDGQANAKTVKAQDYWTKLQEGTEPWIYDATNIKFREIILGYTIPRKVLSKTPLATVNVSFVARNLFTIYSKTDGFDPESGFSTSNAQGIEYGSMPTLRSFGFNLSVGF